MCDPCDRFGYVVAREGLDAPIDVVGSRAVAVEAHHREFGLDHAGTHFAHLDAVREQVGAHRLRNGVHGVLGGAVDGAVLVGFRAGDRPDVEDVPAACGHHLGGDDARDIEQPFDVGVDHGVPVGRVPLVDVFEPGRKPGVVDQQVDAPERFEIAAHGLFAADVERERRAAAACRLDFAAERFEPFATPPRRYDVVAFRREPERRGASDARCGPCDQSLFFHPNNVNMFVSTHVGSCPLGVPGLPSAVPGAAGLRVRPPPGSRLHEAGLPINWVISDKNTK